MSSNVVSFHDHKVKRDFMQPTLDLYKGMEEHFSKQEPNGFYKILFKTLQKFVTSNNDAWIAICTHNAVAHDTGLLTVTYGSFLLDDINDPIVSFKHLSENCTLKGDDNMIYSFLDSIPEKYNEIDSGYMSFVFPVIQLLSTKEASLVYTEIEGDHDVVHLGFVCDYDYIRFSVNNLKMVELNEVISNLPDAKP